MRGYATPSWREHLFLLWFACLCVIVVLEAAQQIFPNLWDLGFELVHVIVGGSCTPCHAHPYVHIPALPYSSSSVPTYSPLQQGSQKWTWTDWESKAVAGAGLLGQKQLPGQWLVAKGGGGGKPWWLPRGSLLVARVFHSNWASVKAIRMPYHMKGLVGVAGRRWVLGG